MRLVHRLADAVTERLAPRAKATASCPTTCTWGGPCGSGGIRRCCWVACHYTCGCVG